ncbi:Serine/threonine-protein kinase PLK [Spironucleus salmonicida]|uniref:Serine/threonine-protein kinase PLK n=1 Tax=Spironucleus salmonicida TaxID=348837 RepID=V6LCS0_9EUKA|nr:Serine/threonine-protein kinase PLK [Spironucleus salmonicida]|eukprot:EST42247.1 Kinase, PLK [Spironucleus salmonicida]
MNQKQISIKVPDIIKDERRLKQYKVGQLLGKGGFAEVYVITDIHTSQSFACKITSKERLTNKKVIEKFHQEIKIHKSLHYLHICEVVSICKDSNNYYIILELCENISLSTLYKRRNGLTEEEIQRVTYELLLSIQELQLNHIVHRDIKPSNIFLKKINSQVITKLGDFGLSAYVKDEFRFTLCGTPNFLSPELIASHVFRRLSQQQTCEDNIDHECQSICKGLPQVFTQGYQYSTDIWSLGCLVYQLAFCKAPFEQLNATSTYKNILKGHINFPKVYKNQYSEFMFKFISQCLIKQPDQRPSVKDLLDDCWIQNGNNIKLKYLPMDIFTEKFSQKLHQLTESFNYTDSITIKCSQTQKLDTEMISVQTYLKETFTQFETTDLTFLLTDGDIQFLYYPSQFFSKRIYPTNSDQLEGFEKLGHFFNNLKQQFYNFHEIYYIIQLKDHSEKYGIAYQLSQGYKGFVFNDRTQVVVSPHCIFGDYTDEIGHTIRFQYDKAEQIVPKKNWMIFLQFSKYLQQYSTLHQNDLENCDLLFKGNEFNLFYPSENQQAHTKLDNFNIEYATKQVQNLSKQYNKIYEKQTVLNLNFEEIEESFLHKLTSFGQLPLPYIKKWKNISEQQFFLLNDDQFQFQDKFTGQKLIVKSNYLMLVNKFNKKLIFDAKIIFNSDIQKSDIFKYIERLVTQSHANYIEFAK